MLLSPAHRRLLLDAAREIIRRTLRDGSVDNVPLPPGPDAALTALAGCFVSLHELGSAHRLRGCVGRMDATRPLWESVHHAAVGVLDDPRFRDDPVTLGELSNLEIEISVLSPMRPVPTPLDFEPETHGIYLTVAGRSGCFLPQVARETGWNREQLLSRLCTEKMGLPPDAWRGSMGVQLQVFSTLLIGPEAFITA